MKRLVATFFIYFAFAIAGAGADNSIQENPVVIEGVLLVGEFIGPPNYGENPSSDRIEHSYYLQLPAPVGMQIKAARSNYNLKNDINRNYFIQLVLFDADQGKAKKLTGKKIRVVGKLFDPETGHHRTPVLIEVQSLSPIVKWDW